MSDEQSRVTGLMPGLLSGIVLAGANRASDPDGETTQPLAQKTVLA